MLVVTDIKVVEVREEHITYLRHMEYPNKGIQLQDINNPFLSSITVTEEKIQGQQFVDYDGREFTIGWSEAAQKAFSLPFNAIEVLKTQKHMLEQDKIRQVKAYNILKKEKNQDIKNSENLKLEIRKLKLEIKELQSKFVNNVIDKICKE